MAPNRARAGEDAKLESSLPSTKHGSGATNAGVSKGKKNGNSSHVGSNLKDVQSVGDSSSSDSAPGVNWTTIPTECLHAYRHAYKVESPAAFTSYQAELSLTNPHALGKYSPSMARRKNDRRISKDNLAMAVRKDFNAAAVHEPEVLTNFMYAVKNKNKHFRMRFTPGKGK